MSKIKILIVDDSALVRQILSTGFSKDPNLTVVAMARDPYEARDFLVQYKPDVVTLDIEMPRMDGVTFLKKFMQIMPVPTVIISSLAEKGKKITLDALQAGAVDIITKPKVGLVDEFPKMMGEIVQRIKIAAKVDIQRFMQAKQIQPNLQTVQDTKAFEETTDKLLAIGSSTGGVEALARIMPAFPFGSPGIVIVQHMPVGFTKPFAERLNSLSALTVKEAEHGDKVRPGVVLVAPGGDRHMSVRRVGGEYRIDLTEGEKVSFNRPSVDVLFDSVAKYVGANAAAAILTGMGKDGANGLARIKDSGGFTCAQNEATCVVYGMPQAAVNIGATKQVLPLEKIPASLIHAVR